MDQKTAAVGAEPLEMLRATRSGTKVPAIYLPCKLCWPLFSRIVYALHQQRAFQVRCPNVDGTKLHVCGWWWGGGGGGRGIKVRSGPVTCFTKSVLCADRLLAVDCATLLSPAKVSEKDCLAVKAVLPKP